LLALFPVLSAFHAPTPAFAGDGPDGETLVYSATGATTAALPLLGALKKGWPQGPSIIEEWKTLDDLRGLVLAGKGDVWVGHLEAFGRAASKGAGVTLLSVTTWRKFYFVSAGFAVPDRDAPVHPASLAELAHLLSADHLPLYASPQSGPATGVLSRIVSLGGPSFDVRSLPLQQTLLELASGRAKAALLPEPGVSAALAKNPSLRIIGSLEDEYARLAGGPARLPHAGVAADPAFVRENPELVEELVRLMGESASELSAMKPEEAVTYLPSTLREGMGDRTLAESFSRDPVSSVRASDVKPEVERFICLAAPEICTSGNLPAAFPQNFIYKSPAASPAK
jgi:NitT/TauT family transport system substrate-binding protein